MGGSAHAAPPVTSTAGPSNAPVRRAGQTRALWRAQSTVPPMRTASTARLTSCQRAPSRAKAMPSRMPAATPMTATASGDAFLVAKPTHSVTNNAAPTARSRYGMLLLRSAWLTLRVVEPWGVIPRTHNLSAAWPWFSSPGRSPVDVRRVGQVHAHITSVVSGNFPCGRPR